MGVPFRNKSWTWPHGPHMSAFNYSRLTMTLLIFFLCISRCQTRQDGDEKQMKHLKLQLCLPCVKALGVKGQKDGSLVKRLTTAWSKLPCLDWARSLSGCLAAKESVK